MGYFNSERQLEELMMRPSREILESPGFKTNVLCMNAGNTEAGQLSNVVTEEEKSKSWAFQEMKEGSYNLMMKEGEQLLNAVVKDFASNEQFFKIDTKDEYQKNDKLEDFVEDIQSLWTVNLEDS